MPICYLSLGSNLGNREYYLKQGVAGIAQHQFVDVLKCSKIYQSPAVGFGKQNDYLNAVIKIQTSIDVWDLLQLCLQVENNNQRQRSGKKWDSRTLDIDILYYGSIAYHYDDLVVPHIFIYQREFVLRPLKDVIEPTFKFNDECIAAKIESILKGIAEPICLELPELTIKI